MQHSYTELIWSAAATLPLTLTLDAAKMNLVRVFQNNFYPSYSTTTKYYTWLLAYVVHCIPFSKMQRWFVSYDFSSKNLVNYAHQQISTYWCTNYTRTNQHFLNWHVLL